MSGQREDARPSLAELDRLHAETVPELNAIPFSIRRRSFEAAAISAWPAVSVALRAAREACASYQALISTTGVEPHPLMTRAAAALSRFRE